MGWGGIVILHVAKNLDLAALQPLDPRLMFVPRLLGASTEWTGSDGAAEQASGHLHLIF